ncbi:MAG: hypothetical protein SFV15_26545 [Polyangiaceae bacterium]|nr:hypothetical protein [Polyangiaceae bacterium]
MSPLFKTLLSHALVATVGGSLGGVAVWSLAGTSRPKVSRELSSAREGENTRAASYEASDGEPVRSAGTRRLEERLATLERQSSAQKAIAQYIERMDPDAGPNDPTLQALVASNNPAFETAVRGVLERVDAQRKEERETEARNRQMERATNAAGVLEQKLKLDGSQKAQVEQAFITAMDAMQKLRESAGPGRGDSERIDWRKAVGEIRQALDKEVAGVLSPSQQKTYEDLKKTDDEVREVSRMFGGRGGGGGPRGQGWQGRGGPESGGPGPGAP